MGPNQALVLVRVLDRNDNAPQFQQLTPEGQIGWFSLSPGNQNDPKFPSKCLWSTGKPRC